MAKWDEDRRDEASVKRESEELIAELVGRGARVIGISEDAPAEVTNAFLRQVLAADTGATTTLLKELQQIGERFCRPVISNAAPVEDSATDEMVGAA